MQYAGKIEETIVKKSKINSKKSKELPELKFTFRMTPAPANTGAHTFKNDEICFIVRDGKIADSLLISANGTRKLQVTERSDRGTSITLEDSYGTLRLVLNMDETQDHCIIAINQPLNQYLLIPNLTA